METTEEKSTMSVLQADYSSQKMLIVGSCRIYLPRRAVVSEDVKDRRIKLRRNSQTPGSGQWDKSMAMVIWIQMFFSHEIKISHEILAQRNFIKCIFFPFSSVSCRTWMFLVFDTPCSQHSVSKWAVWDLKENMRLLLLGECHVLSTLKISYFHLSEIV